MFGWWGLFIGILLLLFGVFNVFFFPSSRAHQEGPLSIGGVFIGLVSLAIGAILIFW